MNPIVKILLIAGCIVIGSGAAYMIMYSIKVYVVPTSLRVKVGLMGLTLYIIVSLIIVYLLTGFGRGGP